MKDIDADFFRLYRGDQGQSLPTVQYVEPKPNSASRAEAGPFADSPGLVQSPSSEPLINNIIRSKVVTLGDFIDTDALAPGPTLTTCHTEEEFGQHVLENTHPEFRSKVAAGQQVVVGGNAFGVGSSRECAVSALKGAGVQAVIARSFAFIYSRNQPSLGLLGIVMDDDAFYEAATEGKEISVDMTTRRIQVAGKDFPFQLSNMEYKLTTNNGIAKTYGRFGKRMWETLMREDAPPEDIKAVMKDDAASLDNRLNW